MAISSDEAAKALRDVDQARGLACLLGGYHRSAAHFLLWGVVWAFIYIGVYVAPPHHAMIVIAGDLVGIVGSIVIAWFTRVSAPAASTQWQTFALIATLAVFMIGATLILQPQTPAQAAAIPAMIVGFTYMQMGIWAGPRFLVVGTAIMLTAIIGYFLLREFYSVCLGVIGGGAMILTGLWLRKA